MQAADEILTNAEMVRLVSGWGGRVAAALVHDGGPQLLLPPSLGAARPDQMQGTVVEQVIEIAGRTCYDSLGKGRPAGEYHDHLLGTGHRSVHEHPHHTLEIAVDGWLPDHLPRFLNRPGVWTRIVPPNKIRVTLDPRSVLEWIDWTLETLDIDPADAADRFGMHLSPSGEGVPNHEIFRDTVALGLAMWKVLELEAPMIFRSKHATVPEYAQGFAGATLEELLHEARVDSIRLVEPETPREEWVTLYLTGSRGWSHELVRHGDWTAISQRSTRYVDENESEWVLHPLIGRYIADNSEGVLDYPASCEGDPKAQALVELRGGLALAAAQAKKVYKEVVATLEAWLLPKLVARGDPYAKASARKQARGAARGVLGNALETEVIFSASVAQWLHMLRMRAADAADAEIRLGFAMGVLPALRASRYAHRFAHVKLQPASDGLGSSLLGGGHK